MVGTKVTEPQDDVGNRFHYDMNCKQSSNSKRSNLQKDANLFVWQSIETEASRRGNTKNNTQKSWLSLDHIPANAANSSEGSTKPIMYPPHVQISELEDRWGAANATQHLRNMQDSREAL